MAISISIRHNLQAVAKDLDDLAKRQLPFATALALTRTAQDARERLRASLPEHFEVRNRWVAGSIVVTNANKRDPDPSASVGSVYEPMQLHVEGGDKRARRGPVGVPVAARATKAERTSPARFPGRLLAQSRFFAGPIPGGGRGVFERVGPKGRQLKLWWRLEGQVRIKRDWPFEEEVGATVNAELFDNFFAALEQARATAR